ncbi:flagellar basal body-associated FliL family protein [Vibrio mediterranei]|uniref:flagellar basal body-associated FliL family protein n=1 Tax=Vibrio mediterranei TaxID=689 RepID=UPI0040696E88
MSNKIIAGVVALTVLIGGGGYGAYHFGVFDKAPAVPVVVHDVEVPLKGVLIQFDHQGRQKLMMLDMALMTPETHEEVLNNALTLVKNRVMLQLSDQVGELYQKPSYQRELQALLKDYLRRMPEASINDVLLTRVVVQ